MIIVRYTIMIIIIFTNFKLPDFLKIRPTYCLDIAITSPGDGLKRGFDSEHFFFLLCVQFLGLLHINILLCGKFTF